MKLLEVVMEELFSISALPNRELYSEALEALTSKLSVHYYGSWISTDADNHRKACSCGLKTEEGAHVYDNDKDIGCNICGHERVIAHALQQRWRIIKEHKDGES